MVDMGHTHTYRANIARDVPLPIKWTLIHPIWCHKILCSVPCVPCGSASRVVGEQNGEHIYSVVSVFESVSVSEVVSVPVSASLSQTVSEPPEQWVSELTYMQGPWLRLKKQTRLALVCVTAGQGWTDMQTGKLAEAQPLKSTAVSHCPNTLPTFHKIYSTDFLLTDQTQLININIQFVNKCIFIAILCNYNIILWPKHIFAVWK